MFSNMYTILCSLSFPNLPHPFPALVPSQASSSLSHYVSQLTALLSLRRTGLSCLDRPYLSPQTLEQLEVNTLETAHLFCASSDACFCSKQHIFTTQPKAAVSNGLLRPVHSFCYFYYCLPYSFHFSNPEKRESAHSFPLKYVLYLKYTGSEKAHTPFPHSSIHFIIFYQPSLAFLSQTDRFCWM